MSTVETPQTKLRNYLAHYFPRQMLDPRAVMALKIECLMDTAPHPVIHETNFRTNPQTGVTDVMFQFRNRGPMLLSLTLDDLHELRERLKVSMIKAGFDPIP